MHLVLMSSIFRPRRNCSLFSHIDMTYHAAYIWDFDEAALQKVLLAHAFIYAGTFEQCGISTSVMTSLKATGIA